MFTITLAAVAIFVLSVVPGVYLWWPSRRDQMCRSDLGVALMTGALIAFAVLTIQVMIERNNRNRDLERQAADARQSFELTLSLQKDLTGIKLDGRDLRRIHFYGKVLRRASLNRAIMDGVVLSDAVLEGATLHEARLPTADMDGAMLADAQLEKANLTGAILTYAKMRRAKLGGAHLQSADLSNAGLSYSSLRGAHLEGASFSSAVLIGADLRGATWDASTGFEGAYYDRFTRWPDGVKQRPCRRAICIAQNPPS